MSETQTLIKFSQTRQISGCLGLLNWYPTFYRHLETYTMTDASNYLSLSLSLLLLFNVFIFRNKQIVR